MNIYEKLLSIQNELNVPKTRFNKFGNFYSRSCEDIVEALKPICKKYNAVLIMTTGIVKVEERFYVRATAILYDCDKEDSFISVSADAREDENKPKMDGSQTTGSATSYSKKYALGNLFNIDDNKDSDELEEEGQGPKPTDKIDVPRQNVIRKELDRVGGTVEWLCGMYKVPTLDTLSYEQYDEIIAKFKATPNRS